MTPEGAVLKAVCDLLAAERIWFRRWNSGAIRDASGRPVRFGQKGDADILAAPARYCGMGMSSDGFHALRTPVFLWIECKSENGKQTAEQKAFESDVRSRGMDYIVARSSDDVLQWLEDNR